MGTRTLPRYMLHRPSGFYARRAVPVALKPVLGVRELLTALGPDFRVAKDRLKHAVADHQRKLDRARDMLKGLDPSDEPIRTPYALDELVHVAAFRELRADEARRDGTAPPLDELEEWNGGKLRMWSRIAAGHWHDDDELVRVVEPILADYRRDKLVHAPVGSPEWYALARRIGMGMVTAGQAIIGRDGATDPIALAIIPDELPGAAIERKHAAPAVSLRAIFDRYLASLDRNGKSEKTITDFRRTLDLFRRHVGHDDAAAITRKDVVAWADKLVDEGLQPRTVNLKKLAPVATAFRIAVDRSDLPSNPAAGYKLDVAKKQQEREQGYTLDEAAVILKASRAYAPPHRDTPANRAREALTPAKRWVPMLAHYTGARLAECAGLDRADVRERDGIPFVRFTKTKSGQFRDVPLARPILDAGFLDYVATRPGPLFHAGTKTGATTSGDRVSDYVKGVLDVDGVSPMHGFRHAFKTIGREAGADPRVLDAIQGHAPRTAGETYGDVTLKAKARALDAMFNVRGQVAT